MAALGDAGIAQRMLKADVLTSVLGMLGKGPGEECTPQMAVQCLAVLAHLWWVFVCEFKCMCVCVFFKGRLGCLVEHAPLSSVFVTRHDMT